MQTYCFTAILKGYSECCEEMADALFEAGVDDALIGSSYRRVTIDFGRDAEILHRCNPISKARHQKSWLSN